MQLVGCPAVAPQVLRERGTDCGWCPRGCREGVRAVRFVIQFMRFGGAQTDWERKHADIHSEHIPMQQSLCIGTSKVRYLSSDNMAHSGVWRCLRTLCPRNPFSPAPSRAACVIRPKFFTISAEPLFRPSLFSGITSSAVYLDTL